ncbi:hypothetical protein HKD37_16G045036 [Glycine soja]|nr:hypothetical protein GmHk_16G046032 [Glycine max]
MASTSGDATPPSPKTTRLMAEMIKLDDQMRRMSYDNEERMETMRKGNEESLGRIHKSNEALKYEGYEKDVGGRMNERYRERRNHRRYRGRQREEEIEGVKGHIASQCPNERTMVVLGNGNITSASFSSSFSESESECDIQPLEGDLLMVRRLMDSVCKDRDETQREKIFHTRCMVMGKICFLIIDGDSCTNVASQRLIKKLVLKTSPHPRLYKLQWLSENGELVVDRQVLICFSICIGVCFPNTK